MRCIVIGAGILGASAAYHLAKKGADVIIIDRKHRGQATDASAGMICPWLTKRRNKAWYRLATDGARYFPELIRQLADDGETVTGYKQTGAIRLEKDTDKLQEIYSLALKRRENAEEIGEVKLLSEKETLALFPFLDEGYQSVWISGAARVDGRAIRDSLLRAAEKNGATVISGTARLERSGNNVSVYADDRKIKGDRIIVAAGAWASGLLSPLGLTCLFTFQKGQIIHLQMPDENTGGWPVVIPPGNKDILPFDAGKIVIGSTHEETEDFDLRITAGGMDDILSKALAVAPGLKEGEIAEIRVGFRPYTPNSLPVFGFIPGFDGLIAANGLGASGLTTAPFLGRQLAKLALDEEPDISVADYDITGAVRQAAGQD